MIARVRNVRGVLFVDYVRMLRAMKSFDWSTHLPAEDLVYLQQRIDPDAWYPMATFERMGNAILATIANNNLTPVKMWGRMQASTLRASNLSLLAENDPVETFNRFHVMRMTLFDFDAIEVLMLLHDEAQITIGYHMGMPAEEAASVQTVGFFEGLLMLAGASEIRSVFREKSWAGDARTCVDFKWRPPTLL
jgi:hypothetical protein